MKILFRRPAGFTLVEILVVLTLISILMSVILTVSLEGRNEAKVVKAYNDIKQFETSLMVYMQDASGSWPTYTTGPERWVGESIEQIVTCTIDCKFPGFEGYLSEIPDDLSEFSIYTYRNYGDPYECGEAHLDDKHTSGVSIRIGSRAGVTDDSGDQLLHDLYEYMNEEVDKDDNPNCGRVRQGGSSNSIYYLIADN